MIANGSGGDEDEDDDCCSSSNSSTNCSEYSFGNFWGCLCCFLHLSEKCNVRDNDDTDDGGDNDDNNKNKNKEKQQQQKQQQQSSDEHFFDSGMLYLVFLLLPALLYLSSCFPHFSDASNVTFNGCFFVFLRCGCRCGKSSYRLMEKIFVKVQFEQTEQLVRYL